jgi:hypothetical protein
VERALVVERFRVLDEEAVRDLPVDERERLLDPERLVVRDRVGEPRDPL